VDRHEADKTVETGHAPILAASQRIAHPNAYFPLSMPGQEFGTHRCASERVWRVRAPEWMPDPHWRQHKRSTGSLYGDAAPAPHPPDL